MNTTSELLEWVREKNKEIEVSIQRCSLSESEFWILDSKDGRLKTKNGSFFSIVGLEIREQEEIISQQPVILQDEIGYLGIITKKINGVLHFLMQAKIEPGNVNHVQISPTIQATRSNFTQLHGGREPLYLDYFLNATKHQIIVDQIQSEQSSRFFKKRNRNIIILVDEEIKCFDNFKWMTLGQIKELMQYDNLVNMDTRTVLSCIPYAEADIECSQNEWRTQLIKKSPFAKSVLSVHNPITEVWNAINDYKMFNYQKSRIIRLDQLYDWVLSDERFYCKKSYPYDIIFCNIKIDGREVEQWTQPLIRATEKALFVLVQSEIAGEYKYLVKLCPEVGCFDSVELGPTLQREATEIDNQPNNKVESIVLEMIEKHCGIEYDVILSEEGGRFYQEQNRNLVIKVKEEQVGELPKEYFWLSFGELNRMVQYNNVLNIQLRNLLSLLEVPDEKN
ncbi:MAG: NDP-hexose 2,3-dehydratase family protein [Lachnospiraceae bacterium]